jgi:hypothetical protein
MIFIACTVLDQEINVKDITKQDTLIIKKHSDQDNVHGIKIKISGTIDGESRISLLLNKKDYKTKKLTGNFSFTWGGDWYSDSAKIIYQPISAKNGDVIIQYYFKDIY